VRFLARQPAGQEIDVINSVKLCDDLMVSGSSISANLVLWSAPLTSAPVSPAFHNKPKPRRRGRPSRSKDSLLTAQTSA